MDVIFKEWKCFDVVGDQEKHIKKAIEKEITSVTDGMSCTPSKLIILVFEIPHTRKLNCYVKDENGKEMVTYIYDVSTGKTEFRFPKGSSGNQGR
jgi:hypothetical protein